MEDTRKTRLRFLRRSRAGQGLVEYLVIIAAILGAIFIIATLIGPAVERLYDNAEAKIDESGDVVGATSMGDALTW